MPRLDKTLADYVAIAISPALIMLMGMIATLAIFHFMWAYNDFFNPLIYLHHQSNYTIALGLQSFNAFRATRYDLLMAASLVTVLPCILLFFFAQRIFIQGIVFSGVKG